MTDIPDLIMPHLAAMPFEREPNNCGREPAPRGENQVLISAANQRMCDVDQSKVGGFSSNHSCAVAFFKTVC